MERATASRVDRVGIPIPVETGSPRAPVEAALKRRVTGGYIAAVLLTIFMGFSSWRSTRLTADDADWVTHTYAAMDTIELTSKHVTEVETSARTFALTGQDSLLAHYEAVKGTAVQEEGSLRRLTADNPGQQRRLDVLDRQVRAALEFADSIVDQRRKRHAVPNAGEVLETEALMGALQATTQEMQAEETRLLSERTERTKAERRLTGFIMVFGALVAAGVLTVAKFAVNREIDINAEGRAQLKTLNADLERRVEQRTAGLRSEIIERTQALKEVADQKFALDQHAIVATTDVQGTITYVNDKFCAISKYSRHELVGQNHRILNSGHHSKEFFRQMYQTIANGQVWRNEICNRAKDGSIYWVDTTVVPFLDAYGKPRQYMAIRADITERKLAEHEILKLTEELEQRVRERTIQLEETNKELEAFTYSVAHDLRAPLRHISGFSKILVEDFGATLDPEARRYLGRVQDGTVKMGRLVDELLSLARVGRQSLNLQATGLNSIVAEVVSLLKPETEGRQIEWRIGDLPFVECDPTLMKQVFQNLVSNALKYSRPRSPAVIEIGEIRKDGQAAIFVRDNGVGFNMKYADKLFGVFQRLHRVEDFEGTGVGLATVQRIIKKHQGRVWAEAELDRGATFYFTIGSVENAAPNAQAAIAGAQP